MKKIVLFGFALILQFGCSGVKKIQEAINTGNYDQAIQTSIANLSNNKTKKSNQPYIVLLEEVFAKNTERELDRIAFYKQEGNPANLESIFTGYQGLKAIQEQIKPLVPLKVYEEGRNAVFNFKDYDQKIIQTKTKLSTYLYKNANHLLLNASNKAEYRKAFEDFKYLNEINPGYKDTRVKMEDALSKGTDYVTIALYNNSEKIIPEKLEAEMLNISTYGLDKLWTVYHSNPLPNVRYDYKVDVSFENITISPEQVKEKEILKEKQIKDGYKYLINSNGTVVKDSLGNKIKVDKFKTVRCHYYQFTQFKSTQVSCMVRVTNNTTKQQINQYPLSSEFVFEHVYATYDGDKRALDKDLISLLRVGAIGFPSNEQMVYNTGEDLKNNLKAILQTQYFN